MRIALAIGGSDSNPFEKAVDRKALRGTSA
jgi:hypothetical protein